MGVCQPPGSLDSWDELWMTVSTFCKPIYVGYPRFIFMWRLTAVLYFGADFEEDFVGFWGRAGKAC